MNVNVFISAASDISIETTLKDGEIQKGSRKTFDVFARNQQGQKIDSSVTLNGKSVKYTWDDTDKTSYTLNFTKEGRNIVVVKAADCRKTYSIIYKKAAKGEKIGEAVYSVELFSIGNGYLIKPCTVDIVEGDTAADIFLKVLHKNGYIAFHTGTVKSGFYLSHIANGDNTEKELSGGKNSRYTVPFDSTPKKLNIKPDIPEKLYNYLTDDGVVFEEYDSAAGMLGEYDFTNRSGWMYSVNGNFPNVGFSDFYPSDGDVVRVQFTVSFGAEIGGAGSMGGGMPGMSGNAENLYGKVNKEKLTALLAKADKNSKNAEVKNACAEAFSLIAKLDAGQKEIDSAYNKLSRAMSIPDDKKPQSSSVTSASSDKNVSKQEPVKSEAASSDAEHQDSSVHSSAPEEPEINTETSTDISSSDTSSVTASSDEEKNENENKNGFIIYIALAAAAVLIIAGTVVFILYKKGILTKHKEN